MSSNIEADVQTGAEEDDSDYVTDGDTASYATSLATAVKNHIYENGRRYNGYREKYFAPNDEQQQNTMDMLHHTISLVREGRLYSAPIGDKPQKILDLGTGTGINTIDLADTFPSAEVTGNDLSAIQPTWIPPNAQFEVDDFTQPWLHKRNSFDYIVGRFLYGTASDWVSVYKEAFAALKPGGYLELLEHSIIPKCDDGTWPPKDSIIQFIAGKFIEAGEMMGRPMQTVDMLAPWMKEAGFVDVVEETYKLPINSWPKDQKNKEIGRFFLAYITEGLPGFVMHVYTNILGWTVQETEAKVQGALAEMKNRSFHAYYPMKVVYGRKPEK